MLAHPEKIASPAFIARDDAARRIAAECGYNPDLIQFEISRRSFGSFSTTLEYDRLPLYQRAMTFAMRARKNQR